MIFFITQMFLFLYIHLIKKIDKRINTLSKCPGEMCPGGFPGQYIFWNCDPGPKLRLPGQ